MSEMRSLVRDHSCQSPLLNRRLSFKSQVVLRFPVRKFGTPVKTFDYVASNACSPTAPDMTAKDFQSAEMISTYHESLQVRDVDSVETASSTYVLETIVVEMIGEFVGTPLNAPHQRQS